MPAQCPRLTPPDSAGARWRHFDGASTLLQRHCRGRAHAHRVPSPTVHNRQCVSRTCPSRADLARPECHVPVIRLSCGQRHSLLPNPGGRTRASVVSSTAADGCHGQRATRRTCANAPYRWPRRGRADRTSRACSCRGFDGGAMARPLDKSGQRRGQARHWPHRALQPH
jgi:hypothetical protein